MSRTALHAALILFTLAPLALADHAAQHQNIGKDRLAIQGYDPVSYFQNGSGPIKGSEKITVEHQGAIYRFATSENREKFTAHPAGFVPAYGGWCATAMAEGRKIEIDPRNFKIAQGRLLLFYKSIFVNAQKDWNADEARLFPKADAAWNKLVGH